MVTRQSRVGAAFGVPGGFPWSRRRELRRSHAAPRARRAAASLLMWTT